MNPSRRERWLWLISIVGLLVWGGFLWNLVHEIRTEDVFLPPALTFLLGSGLSLGLVYAGYRFVREDWINEQAARRILGWGLGGLALVTLLRGLTLLIRESKGLTIPEPQVDVLVSLGGGMIAGTLAGFLYEHAKYEAKSARESKDALAFLNRTLRHECLNGLNVVEGNIEHLESELDGSESEERLAVIGSRLSDMSGLIQNIRVFSNAVTGVDHRPSVELTAVLRSRVAAINESYPEVDLTADLPRIPPREG